MIQPVREGLKERLFELHSMASQFLTRPAVHYLQRVLSATNAEQAFPGQKDSSVIEMLKSVKEGWAIFSRDATGATDWQSKTLSLLFLESVRKLADMRSVQDKNMGYIVRSLEHFIKELLRPCEVSQIVRSRRRDSGDDGQKSLGASSRAGCTCYDPSLRARELAFSWENSRTKWPFSIATLNYQRVVMVSSGD